MNEREKATAELEANISRLVDKGLDTQAIASRLGLHPRSVNAIKRRIARRSLNGQLQAEGSKF